MHVPTTVRTIDSPDNVRPTAGQTEVYAPKIPAAAPATRTQSPGVASPSAIPITAVAPPTKAFPLTNAVPHVFNILWLFASTLMRSFCNPGALATKDETETALYVLVS